MDNNIISFCLSHRPIEFNLPSKTRILWLSDETNCQAENENTIHLSDVSDKLQSQHKFLGASAGVFAILDLINRNIIKVFDDDFINILQYRKFLLDFGIGTTAPHCSAMRLPKTYELTNLNLDNFLKLHIDTIKVCEALNINQTIIHNYASNHHLQDLLRYLAVAVEIQAIDKNEVSTFLNDTIFIPCGIELGIFKVSYFKILAQQLRNICDEFLKFNIPHGTDSYQRRALAFCNERFASYQFLKLIRSKPNLNYFAVLHNVSEEEEYKIGL